jgi:6-phosphofructo-2-kinase
MANTPNQHPLPTPITNITNIANILDKDFAISEPAFNTFVTPPTPQKAPGGALAQVLHGASMTADTSHGFHDGVGHPLSDTPIHSEASTAPGSPRM